MQNNQTFFLKNKVEDLTLFNLKMFYNNQNSVLSSEG